MMRESVEFFVSRNDAIDPPRPHRRGPLRAGESIPSSIDIAGSRRGRQLDPQ